MEEFAGLLKLLPEGVSVSAVVVVLTIGIKYIQSLHANHKEDKEKLITSHSETTKLLLDNHKEERERFQEVLTEANETNKQLMLSHKEMMGEHLKTSAEMVTAVRGLESAVRDLQSKVK